jgi:hypothetical protein
MVEPARMDINKRGTKRNTIVEKEYRIEKKWVYGR